MKCQWYLPELGISNINYLSGSELIKNNFVIFREFKFKEFHTAWASSIFSLVT